ncbi:cupin domain-containing protein [Xanthobacteraceae bacterium A53D]
MCQDLPKKRFHAWCISQARYLIFASQYVELSLMIRREHVEARRVHLEQEWEPLSGFEGLQVKVLSSDLDEQNKRGGRTRLVRFAPGARTSGPLVHDYWEEVFVLIGNLAARGEHPRDGDGIVYSLRPPGTAHGPFESEHGCMLLEVQYYAA